MEGLLRDIPLMVVYIDDILITGKTEQKHLTNIASVLTRLKEEGLTLKEGKCSFMLDKVEYLSHVVSGKGLQPSKSKMEGVSAAPPPQNVSQLR